MMTQTFLAPLKGQMELYFFTAKSRIFEKKKEKHQSLGKINFDV